MLEAQDVARKIASGCGHTATVVVPCSGCIENQMKAWEASIRENAKAAFRDDWLQANAELLKSQTELKRLNEMYELLSASLVRMTEQNQRLSGALKEYREQVDGLKAQLLAEQGMKAAVRMARPKAVAK